MSDLRAYWTTGPGSQPLRKPVMELTRREAVGAFCREFLAAPTAGAVLGAILGTVLSV